MLLLQFVLDFLELIYLKPVFCTDFKLVHQILYHFLDLLCAMILNFI